MNSSSLQDPSSFVPLLAYQREGVTEVVIHGAILIVHGDEVIEQVGGDFLCYGRSLLKPFQMKVFAQDFSPQASLEAKAISVASHNGEARHIEAAREFFAAAAWRQNPTGDPVSESRLQTPASFALAPGLALYANEKRPINHPCSGKHAAILRGCEMRGWPLETYLRQEHPYHPAFMTCLRQALGPAWEPSQIAVDGCGLPVPTLRLSEMARCYSYLARERTSDWIWQAMVERPEWVGGTGRLDTGIMQASGGRVLAKEGADGLLALAMVHEKYPRGLSAVIKISHGWNPTATSFLARSILNKFSFNFEAFVAPEHQSVILYETNPGKA